MIKLAEKLEISPKVIESLNLLINKDKAKIYNCAEMCKSKGFHLLKGKNKMFILAVILKLAVDIKARYDEAGIDESIYYDTMSDIKIWCEKEGEKGLANYDWLKNHVSFNLFRLGRLQFQIYKCNNKTLLYNKLPFEYGSNLIYIHIPEGQSLEEEKCREALSLANKFFKEYFPEYKYEYYFCESWLLFENNKDFMRKDSNIIKFMSLFTLCYSVKIDAQAIERIFGKRKILKSCYSENTSLQKSAKEYMLSGKRLGTGIGVIRKTDIGCY